MFRRIFPISSPILGLFPVPINDFDKVSSDSETAQAYHNQSSQIDNETGWERLYMMFSVDEFQSVSPELNSVYQATYLSLFTGACIGGVIRSRGAYLEFLERNQATTFTSHLQAKRKLQDFVTVNFAKGAFQWGWRLAAFSGTYVLVTTTISVYRGKSSIWEYLAAGSLTGALYKLNLGVRGIVVGGGLGGVLGGVAGAISLGILALSGSSMQEIRYWQYKWKTSRESQERRTCKVYLETNEDPLVKQHNRKVGSISNDLGSIDNVVKE